MGPQNTQPTTEPAASPAPTQAAPEQMQQAQQAPATKAGLPASWLPTQNKPALIGYYLGFAGLLPFVGFPFAVAAVVLGIIALKKEKVQHVPGAKAHAFTALVLGLVEIGFMALFVAFVAAGSQY
jgi:hypothetical protein